MRPPPLRTASAALAALVLIAALATPAQAGPLDDVFAKLLAKRVTASHVHRHLATFQAIAEANGGNRAVGTPGYAASSDYVAQTLRKAGYLVSTQPIKYVKSWTENNPTLFQQTAPAAKTYTSGADFFTIQASAAGDVTGQVQSVDLVLPPTPVSSSTSGCERADFAGFVRGRIALIQRGTCPFVQKLRNAEEAGAAGVIIFNEGQPDRTEAYELDLGEWRGGPMVFTDYAVGAELAASPGATVRIKTDTTTTFGSSTNVIAETRQGDPRNVVMVGAHLDGVPEGPGINDNGSGAAAILETALQLRNVPVRNRVRFGFWGAEEIGLLGSEQYIRGLPQTERDRVRLYLNFDMVASPNYAIKIYDGDDSDAAGSPAGPPGSAQIEKQLERFYDQRGVGHVGTDFDARSDYDAFVWLGIPAGGIFTGAEGLKTPAEATLFGGTAGVAYDPCYHAACDTLTNIDMTALDVNADAIADSTARFAFNLHSIPTRPATTTTSQPLSTPRPITTDPENSLQR